MPDVRPAPWFTGKSCPAASATAYASVRSTNLPAEVRKLWVEPTIETPAAWEFRMTVGCCAGGRAEKMRPSSSRTERR